MVVGGRWEGEGCMCVRREGEGVGVRRESEGCGCEEGW